MVPNPSDRRWPLLFLALMAVGCAPGTRTAHLRAPETFNWAGRAILLAPPPPDWRTEGYNEGGWLGVYYVHTHSVGERILVADNHLVASRDDRPALRDILDRFETLDMDRLRRAITLARARTDDPLSALEADIAARVNESLDRAMDATFQEDREGARREIGGAEREAEGLRVSLRDVIARIEFRPETRQEPRRWQVTGRRRARVAGDSAVVVDYLFKSPERTYSCRDVYFVHENHLFEASYLGLKRNLPVFDQLVASLSFPPRRSEGS